MSPPSLQGVKFLKSLSKFIANPCESPGRTRILWSRRGELESTILDVLLGRGFASKWFSLKSLAFSIAALYLTIRGSRIIISSLMFGFWVWFVLCSKPLIKLTKTRIVVVRRKRKATEKFLKKDIADLLANGLDINAYQRVNFPVFGLLSFGLLVGIWVAVVCLGWESSAREQEHKVLSSLVLLFLKIKGAQVIRRCTLFGRRYHFLKKKCFKSTTSFFEH